MIAKLNKSLRVNNASRTTHKIFHKPRPSSLEGQRQVAENALKAHEPPEDIKLTVAERRCFDRLVASRAYDEWSGSDLMVAARLAQTQAEITQRQVAGRRDPAVVSSRGRVVINPSLVLIDRLIKRELQQLRLLSLTGSRQVGKAHEMQPLRQAERVARRRLSGAPLGPGPVARAAIDLTTDDDALLYGPVEAAR